MTGGTAVTLATIITDIGSLVTGMMTWAGSVLTTITGAPLLMLGILMGFAGAAIGAVKRLLRL